MDIMVWLKIKYHTIILISMVKCIFKTRNCLSSYNPSRIIYRDNEIKVHVEDLEGGYNVVI